MNRVFASALTMAVLACFTAPAFAESLPSSKAAWAWDNLIALRADASTNAGSANETPWLPILTTQIKTPNGKELAIGVSLQCGLVTDTKVASKGGNLDTSEARGRIRVRVKIEQPDGTTVYAQPDNGADLSATGTTDGVTYCDRFQKLEARFAGFDCTVDLTGAVTCASEEELRLILKTMSAHHFNFLHGNALPGVQTVTVEARAQANVALGTTSSLGAASAEAFTGAGALSVETIRLIKDAEPGPPPELQ